MVKIVDIKILLFNISKTIINNICILIRYQLITGDSPLLWRIIKHHFASDIKTWLNSHQIVKRFLFVRNSTKWQKCTFIVRILINFIDTRKHANNLNDHYHFGIGSILSWFICSQNDWSLDSPSHSNNLFLKNDCPIKINITSSIHKQHPIFSNRILKFLTHLWQYSCQVIRNIKLWCNKSVIYRHQFTKILFIEHKLYSCYCDHCYCFLFYQNKE